MNNGSVANPGTIDQPQTDVDLLEESILYKGSSKNFSNFFSIFTLHPIP